MKKYSCLDTKYFGHMTKPVAMPIHGKTHLKISFQNKKAGDLGTSYVAFGMGGLLSVFK